MTTPRARLAALLALVVVMVALHQDVWLWRDARRLFGVLPVGLAWHVGYSVLSALVMAALVRFAWPRDLDDEAPAAAPAARDEDARR